MNDNNLMNNESNQGKYRATRNLNTAIENPEININSVTGVNIQDISSDNSISNNDTIDNYFNDGTGINNNVEDNNDNTETINTNIKEVTDIAANTNKFINNSMKHVEQSEINNTPSYEQPKKQVHYEPTLKEKKTEKQTPKIPSELLVMFLVVIILLIVVIIIPYIYDFIQEVKLNLTT